MGFVRQTGFVLGNGTFLGGGGSGSGFTPKTISSVIPMGDSISEQNFSGGNQRFNSGVGYATWARLLGGSLWDFTPGDYATSGAVSSAIYAAHLAAAIASPADLIIDQAGVNDAIQSVPIATTVANRRAAWAAIRAAGKQVVALATTPIALSFSGNGAGVVSARVAALNVAQKPAALADGVPWIDVSTPLELVPGLGNGVGDPANFADGLHPNNPGAYKMGGILNGALSVLYTGTVNPLAISSTILTVNGDFALGSVTPDNFSQAPPVGGTTGTMSVATAELGLKWWTIQMTKGVSTAPWVVTNLQNNVGGAPANKVVDTICLLQVTSGAISLFSPQFFSAPGGSSYTNDVGVTSGPLLTPADGIKIFRSFKHTVASDRTVIYMSTNIIPVADATIKLALFSLRQFP